MDNRVSLTRDCNHELMKSFTPVNSTVNIQLQFVKKLIHVSLFPIVVGFAQLNELKLLTREFLTLI